MDVEVLNHFLTVVREENISRAAERLHVTQPTLSRQMAALEEELGTLSSEARQYASQASRSAIHSILSTALPTRERSTTTHSRW